MFWPLGDNVLVRADHMDIVGQFHRLPAEPGGRRTCRTYDLLKSDSGFDDKTFKKTWNEIFAFSLGRSHAQKTSAA